MLKYVENILHSLASASAQICPNLVLRDDSSYILLSGAIQYIIHSYALLHSVNTVCVWVYRMQICSDVIPVY